MQSRPLSRMTLAPDKSLCALDCELRCALQQLCRLDLCHVLVGNFDSRSLNPALQQPGAPFEVAVIVICAGSMRWM